MSLGNKMRTYGISFTCFVLIALGASTIAHADILFVNFHNSTSELKAVREAAAARGEAVILIPNMTPAEEQQYESYAHEEESIDHLITITKDKKALEALAQKYAVVQTGFATLSAKYPITKDKIDEALVTAEKAGRTISSVIISGHHNGTAFWNESSSVDTADFQAVFAAHPALRDQVHGIYLWGCYSTVLGSVAQWKDSFPKAGMILGYSDSAPSSFTQASGGLLKDSLIKEKAIIEKKDLKDVETAFKNLNSVLVTNAAATINSCYVTSTSHAVEYDDAMKKCDEAKKLLEDGFKTFHDYYDGAKYDDPPVDEHHSELRTFYSNLQKYGNCRSLPASQNAIVLGLIFYQNVRKNFGRYYQNDVVEANKVLMAHHFDSDLLVPDLMNGTLSRKELMARFAKTAAELEKAWTDWPLADMAAVANVLKRMKTMVIDLVCVPPTWITELPSVDRLPVAPQDCHLE